MATNTRLFLNQCKKILLTVKVSTSFTLFSYILCIFVCGLVENNRKQCKNGELIPKCGKFRASIILDDKTLQYVHVPIAYRIHQIIYKTMALSILVSIFKHDSNVFSAILAANGQTWHEYALTVVNSPMRLPKGYTQSPYFHLLRQNALIFFPYILYTILQYSLRRFYQTTSFLRALNTKVTALVML